MASDKYFSRMGWMARNHPIELPSGRILVPLYSDGYNLSLIAITDDGGRTWSSSEPLVSLGGVQPSLVRKRDGTSETLKIDSEIQNDTTQVWDSAGRRASYGLGFDVFGENFGWQADGLLSSVIGPTGDINYGYTPKAGGMYLRSAELKVSAKEIEPLTQFGV